MTNSNWFNWTLFICMCDSISVHFVAIFSIAATTNQNPVNDSIRCVGWLDATYFRSLYAVFVHFQIANRKSQWRKSDLRQKQVKMILCAMFEELISEPEAIRLLPSTLFVARFVWSHVMGKHASKMNVYGDCMKSLVGKQRRQNPDHDFFLSSFLSTNCESKTTIPFIAHISV